jgi:hypothetical protein
MFVGDLHREHAIVVFLDNVVGLLLLEKLQELLAIAEIVLENRKPIIQEVCVGQFLEFIDGFLKIWNSFISEFAGNLEEHVLLVVVILVSRHLCDQLGELFDSDSEEVGSALAIVNVLEALDIHPGNKFPN